MFHVHDANNEKAGKIGWTPLEEAQHQGNVQERNLCPDAFSLMRETSTLSAIFLWANGGTKMEEIIQRQNLSNLDLIENNTKLIRNNMELIGNNTKAIRNNLNLIIGNFVIMIMGFILLYFILHPT